MVSTKEKFVVIPACLLTADDAQMVILTDYQFWAEVEDELKKWCNETNSVFAGMTVTIPDACTLTAFVLKWS